MSVQPLRDFIVVTKEEGPKQSAGGILLPGNSEEKMVTGTVTAVGSGRVSIDGTVVPLEVHVGDRIAFNKNLATELKVAGEAAYILREDQVLCIIK